MSHRRTRALARAQEFLRQGNVVAAEISIESMLQQAPLDGETLVLHAQIALRQRRIDVAARRALHAAAVFETHGLADALPALAYLLLDLGEHDTLARLLAAYPPDHPALLANAVALTQYLGLANQHAASLALAERALRDRPHDADLRYAQATALRHLGRLADAREALQACLAQAPSHAQAHWSLASLGRDPDPVSRVGALRRVLAQPPRDARDRIALGYALFKTLDDADDSRAAWEALDQAKRLQRRFYPYDDDAEAQFETRLRALCTPSFLADAAAPSEPSKQRVPIFIVGLPRTGTTVLERILGNHSAVRSAGEIGDLHLELCRQIGRPVSGICDPRLLDGIGAVDFADVGARYLRRTDWRADGASFLIDKLPPNLWLAGFIRKALPQARILCLRRGPMDSLFSNYKELFPGGHYGYSADLQTLAAHYLRFDRMVRHFERVMPDAWLTVRYEDLVAQPAAVATRVLRHCGLPFEAGCVDITSNTAPSSTASSAQVREPIHGRNVGAWTRYAAELAPARAALAAHGVVGDV